MNMSKRIVPDRLKRLTPDAWERKIELASMGFDPRYAVWATCVVWWDISYMWTIGQREDWKNKFVAQYDSRTYFDLDENELGKIFKILGYKQRRRLT